MNDKALPSAQGPVTRHWPPVTHHPSPVTYAPLRAVLGHRLLEREPLKRHTTWRVGGPADAFAVARTLDELQGWVALANAHGIPWRVIGNGSNLLVADEGVRAFVIKNACNGIERQGAWVRAEAGAMLARVANQAAAAGLAGFEFAAGIPGTVGGAVVNNAGAHGACMADVLRRVEALAPDGRVATLEAQELELGYRTSRFKARAAHAGARVPAAAGPTAAAVGETGRWAAVANVNGNPGREVVLSAELELQPCEAGAVRRRQREFTRSRTASQPLTMPSAGSVFTNPEGAAAGFLIEQCGLKGHRVGGAEISTVHANFIVNLGGATARDVLALIALARCEVLRRWGVTLRTEIEALGFGDDVLST